MLTLTILFGLVSLSFSTIVLRPLGDKLANYDATLILVQGASIPSSNYVAFANQLQQTYNGRLWVAIASGFPFDLPEPLFIETVMTTAFNDLMWVKVKILIAVRKLFLLTYKAFKLKLNFFFSLENQVAI